MVHLPCRCCRRNKVSVSVTTIQKKRTGYLHRTCTLPYCLLPSLRNNVLHHPLPSRSASVPHNPRPCNEIALIPSRPLTSSILRMSSTSFPRHNLSTTLYLSAILYPSILLRICTEDSHTKHLYVYVIEMARCVALFSSLSNNVPLNLAEEQCNLALIAVLICQP